jgi:hypothetical protein
VSGEAGRESDLGRPFANSLLFLFSLPDLRMALAGAVKSMTGVGEVSGAAPIGSGQASKVSLEEARRSGASGTFSSARFR